MEITIWYLWESLLENINFKLFARDVDSYVPITFSSPFITSHMIGCSKNCVSLCFFFFFWYLEEKPLEFWARVALKRFVFLHNWYLSPYASLRGHRPISGAESLGTLDMRRPTNTRIAPFLFYSSFLFFIFYFNC